MTSTEAEQFSTVADDLVDVVEMLDDVDLNAMYCDDDVRAVLDAKQSIQEMCLRYRRNQHAAEEPR